MQPVHAANDITQMLQRIRKGDKRAESRPISLVYEELHRDGGHACPEEFAEVMQLAARTVKRDWKYSRAWLKRKLGRGNT